MDVFFVLLPNRTADVLQSCGALLFGEALFDLVAAFINGAWRNIALGGDFYDVPTELGANDGGLIEG